MKVSARWRVFRVGVFVVLALALAAGLWSVCATKPANSMSPARPGLPGSAYSGLHARLANPVTEPTFRSISATAGPEELWVMARPSHPALTPAHATPSSGALLAEVHDQEVPMPLKHTDVRASISGYISSVEVVQQFLNPYSSKIEAVCVFPLPHNAAVNEFIMTIGHRRIRGIIRERKEAEAIYEAAKRQGYVASLLTEERPNIFRQSVANIEPGRQMDVTIRYFNTLDYVDGWFDLLGLERGAATTDAGIGKTLDNARRVRLHSGDSILLIQSGAFFPDGTMVTQLSKHFRVVPFSGVPSRSRSAETSGFESPDAESYSRSLRLAATRGGNDVILCYWGILESENAKLPTKTVSWVPVVRWFVPDEREHMRLRLKMALIDARTGNWAVLSPPPVKEARISTAPRRGVADQKLVADLKQRALTAGAGELLRRYSDVAALN